MSTLKPEKLPDQTWRATQEAATFDELETFLVDEIFKNSNLNPEGFLRKATSWFFSPYIRKIVKKANEFDLSVEEKGFSRTAKEWMEKWTPGVLAEGVEEIPSTGPFLVVANHPGTYDSLAVIASLKRRDYKLIVSANPFFRILPNTKEWFIFTTRDPHVRMATLRRAVRFLQSGGLLVVFPSGKLEPDPCYFPAEALKALDWWSDSPNFFKSHVPGLGLSVAICSAVNDPKYLKHPLARLRTKNYDRQKVAEFLQVVSLLIQDKTVSTQPRVQFSNPIWYKDITAINGDLHTWTLRQAQSLMINSSCHQPG